MATFLREVGPKARADGLSERKELGDCITAPREKDQYEFGEPYWSQVANLQIPNSKQCVSTAAYQPDLKRFFEGDPRNMMELDRGLLTDSPARKSKI